MSSKIQHTCILYHVEITCQEYSLNNGKLKNLMKYIIDKLQFFYHVQHYFKLMIYFSVYNCNFYSIFLIQSILLLPYSLFPCLQLIMGSLIDTYSPIAARYCFSLPPENIRKPLGFLMFSGDIEKQHLADNGLSECAKLCTSCALIFYMPQVLSVFYVSYVPSFLYVPYALSYF